MIFRFASFELNVEQRELRKCGDKIPLRQKPLRILELLLRQPGFLVTRRELARELWPGLHVNFERGLNSAVNSLRQALGDSSRERGLIETRSGLGYRFIAPVEVCHHTDHDYLRGRYFLDKMTPDGTQRAIGCFQSVLQANPQNALAISGMADAYSQLGAAEPAREWAARALKLAPNLAEAHASHGRVAMTFDWDWNGALASFQCSTALNPALRDTRRSHALLLGALRRHADSLREMRRAEELDPLSLPVGCELAWLLYLAGDFQGAAEQAWKVLALAPAFALAQTTLGLAYEQMGSHEEALTELENACLCSGRQPSAVAALGHLHAARGSRPEARKLLTELVSQSASPYWLALIHTGLGRHAEARADLQLAYSRRDPQLLWLTADPRLPHTLAEIAR